MVLGLQVDEFLDVYNKNINLVQNDNQKDIDDYLELYLNYKLKLLEARALKYDQKQKNVIGKMLFLIVRMCFWKELIFLKIF